MDLLNEEFPFVSCYTWSKRNISLSVTPRILWQKQNIGYANLDFDL